MRVFEALISAGVVVASSDNWLAVLCLRDLERELGI